MARKKMQEPERWITVNGQHLPVYPGGVIGQPGQTPPAKESKTKSKTPAVNDKGTMSPKKLSDAEDRRDQLWDKEDKGTITAAEKKELEGLQKSISEHYTEKKNQMAGKKSSGLEYRSGMTKEERRQFLDDAPEGTRITGLIDKRTGNELIVEKQGGYSQVYGGVGAGSKNYESYWTIAGEKNPYIAKNLRQAEEGTSPYYEFKKSSASKPATTSDKVSNTIKKAGYDEKEVINTFAKRNGLTAEEARKKLENARPDDIKRIMTKEQRRDNAFQPATTSRNAKYDTSRANKPYSKMSISEFDGFMSGKSNKDLVSFANGAWQFGLSASQQKELRFELKRRGYKYEDGKWIKGKSSDDDIWSMGGHPG